MRLGIVLLAAGVGKRFGGNKLTAQVRGKPMYLWAMENIEEMKTELPIVVVTGTPEIVSAAEAKGMIAIFNGQPELGISLSIRLGIEAVIQEDRKVDGILFMVCDQPWLEKTTLVRLMSEFDGGILALSFGERRGNPVIFSREYLKELSELSGDIGGRQVMARHRENVRFLEVNDERELQDIDKRDANGSNRKTGGNLMDTIYMDQLTTLMPKGDGVEEAMEAAVNMDISDIQTMADETREQLNKLFHGPGADSVVFTSGVDAALDGLIRALFKDGDHVLISSMENDTVMNALNAIGHEADEGVSGGVEYTRIPCNEKGQLIFFDPVKGEKGFDAVEKLLRPNTKAVIVNHASEVCGTILQAKEISEFARRHGLLVIVNAAQTAGCVPIFMNIWGVDLMTFSGGYGLFASEKIGGFIASERAAAMLGGPDMRGKFEQKPLDAAGDRRTS